MFRNIFVIPAERRARMMWRLLGQALLLFVFMIPLGFVLVAIYLVQAGPGADPTIVRATVFQSVPLVRAVSSLSMLAAFVGSIWVASLLLDRRPLADFGLRLNAAWWRDLGFGLLLGAVLMLVIFLVELALGWITVTDTFYVADGGGFGLAISASVVHFLGVGIYEEMFSRGYHMTNLAQGMRKLLGPRGGLIAGWVLSSAIFGVLHAANPNATLLSTMNIVVAGMFLGFGYLLNGRLGIPIGVHITWNFFQGNVFGFPVSGSPANAVTFIAVEQGGSDLLTGGAFGPEGGLIGLAAIALGAALTAMWVRQRGGPLRLYTQMTEPRRVEQVVLENGTDIMPEVG
jgi:membrane protease YdiL (CAAX protease family)